MFDRLIITDLEKWLKKPNRKPLVLRGARQVGKTTLINQFSKQFEHYIYLNLETPADKVLFQEFSSIESLVQAIFFNSDKLISAKNKTLLFIDEIQEVPEAFNMLRYFFESEPDFAVIAAGSMLETLFNKASSFPVGRVEYKILRPVSFPEFLGAMDEIQARQQLLNIPLQPFAYSKLLKLFHTYALIGGMPEIVNQYVKNKDILELSPIYNSLISSYLDDVEKYATNAVQILHIRHAIRTSYAEAGKRIKFEGFGNSLYRSREMGESLRTLEKALLIHLVYPNTTAVLPLLPDLKKSPRLQVLDTGLLNYFVGIQREVLGTQDLNAIYQGTLIEHLTGQELLAFQHDSLSNLHFWVREKKESSAEVDYLYQYEGKLIPIEVKSGSEGRLKSLHIYMDMAPHNLALRFYAGELKISESTTRMGKKYYLLNLPYFLVSQVPQYLKWFEDQIRKNKD